MTRGLQREQPDLEVQCQGERVRRIVKPCHGALRSARGAGSARRSSPRVGRANAPGASEGAEGPGWPPATMRVDRRTALVLPMLPPLPAGHRPHFRRACRTARAGRDDPGRELSDRRSRGRAQAQEGLPADAETGARPGARRPLTARGSPPSAALLRTPWCGRPRAPEPEANPRSRAGPLPRPRSSDRCRPRCGRARGTPLRTAPAAGTLPA